MDQPKTSSTTAIDTTTTITIKTADITTTTSTTTTSMNTSSNTTQDARIQPNGNKGVGWVFLILSIVAGGFAYFYMDLTLDLIYKNELIFKLCSALAALLFGSLALVLNCKLLLAFTVALLTTTATLNEKLFSVSNFISESEQKYTLLATFATEFLIATLLCMLFPIIQKILLKE